MQIIAASHLLPISSEPLEGGAIAFEDGIIRGVGTLAELRRSFTCPVLEFPGHALMPGLVNAHTHLELTHFPAWLLRKDLQYAPRTYVDWIIQLIKIKRTLTHEELTASLGEGLHISLQAGTTMVGDILSDSRLLPSYGGNHVAGRIYLEQIGHGTLPDDLPQVVNRFKTAVPDPFLAGISPHAPFTVSFDYFNGITAAARNSGLPLTMHLAESREEASFFHDTSGRIATELYPFVGWGQYLPSPLRTTPAGWVHGAGGFGPDFLAVHGVHVSSSDARLIKNSGATIVLCPRSNQRLDVGVAPVPLYKSLGIPLAIGTDSLASNDSLSLWDEMRYLLEIFPGHFSHADLLQMGTHQGASAIGRGHEAGSLETGKRADFLLMEPLHGEFSPDIEEQILFNSRVSGVWTGGEAAVRVD